MPPRGSNGISRIGLWTSIAASAVLLLGALGGFFYVAFETRANSDRLDVQGQQIQIMSATLNESHSRISGLEMSLNEIETQFCGEDIVRNLMHANDMRTQSLLWSKAFPGSVLPTDNAYYPNICNRKAGK